jgi:hypothetical protein
MNMNGTTKLPQPNDNNTIVHAMSTNALYEPSAGKSHVFSPDGLFPFFNNTFTCGDSLACGVSAGADAKFEGTFEQGNAHNLTGYTATYTSPITYGPQQMAGHTYKIILTDTMWNNTGSTMPTRQAEFTKMVNNVGFDQIQHGASHVDRSDVPQLYDKAFLYGHTKIVDVTNGNNTVVAENVFTHVMVAHVMDEKSFYRSLKDDAKSPWLVFLFAINIPSGVDLPGKVPSLTPEQAQGFTPLPSDPSLSSTPQFAYPVQIEHAGMTVGAPMSQSTTWPVDNSKQPLIFNFLVYQNTDVKLKSMSDMTPNPQQAKLTVKAVGEDGKDLRMFIRVAANDGKKTIISEGFAPFTFTGIKGNTYQVRATNFDGLVFDRWADDGSTNRHRMVTLNSDEMELTAQYAAAGNIKYGAHLSGSKEVPPVNTTAATGMAEFALNADATKLSYKLNVTGIDKVTMAHLHLSPEGVNGPIVVVLYHAAPDGMVNGVLAQGTITSADLTGPLAGKPLIKLIDEISSGQVYVNVHSSNHPGGEMRGQLG